jgi:hypothetical protein
MIVRIFGTSFQITLGDLRLQFGFSLESDFAGHREDLSS